MTQDTNTASGAADLRKALVIAEAALADIGDADREPGDDLAWCEARAAQALPEVRAALASTPAQPTEPAPDAVFEFWWADHMPNATQTDAWAEWCALRSNQPADDPAQPVAEPAKSAAHGQAPAPTHEQIAAYLESTGAYVTNDATREAAIAEAIDTDRAKRGQAPDLHPKTSDLVQRFAAALAEKLSAAEKKYGYSDGWASPNWIDECRQHLSAHIAKGDPRDVAAYCAFLWHHGATTASPQAEQQAPTGSEIYVCARKCYNCGHAGINDDHADNAACKSCDWSGPSPEKDHCPDCEKDGTMTAACPMCSCAYIMVADTQVAAPAALNAPQAADTGTAPGAGIAAGAVGVPRDELPECVIQLQEMWDTLEKKGKATSADLIRWSNALSSVERALAQPAASHGQAPAGATEPTEQQILEAAEKAGLWPNTVRSWIPAFHRYHKELAKARPAPAQAAPAAVAATADSVQEDAARLDWLLLRISGAEFRRLGVHYSGNARRADVDAARKQGEKQ